jgi:hypothetical protein
LEERKREERAGLLIASDYHAVLAVKDEREDARSPPAAVFDP